MNNYRYFKQEKTFKKSWKKIVWSRCLSSTWEKVLKKDNMVRIINYSIVWIIHLKKKRNPTGMENRTDIWNQIKTFGVDLGAFRALFWMKVFKSQSAVWLARTRHVT